MENIQLSLENVFGSDKETENVNTKIIDFPKKTSKNTKGKPQKPEILKRSEMAGGLLEFMEIMNINKLEARRTVTNYYNNYGEYKKEFVTSKYTLRLDLNSRNYVYDHQKEKEIIPFLFTYNKNIGCGICEQQPDAHVLTFPFSGNNLTEFSVAYVDEDMNVWTAKMCLSQEESGGALNGLWNFSRYQLEDLDMSKRCLHIKFSIGKWTLANKMVYACARLQSEMEIWQNIKKNNKYLAEYAAGQSKSVLIYALMPYLELLEKMDVNIAQKMNIHVDKKQVDIWNRLFQNGKNPKEFCKIPMWMFELLKEEEDFNKWDVYRKLFHTKKASMQEIEILHEEGYSRKHLDKINIILAKQYEGKKLFTFKSLSNYLTKLDMFEAIELDEALDLLEDYIGLCSFCSIKPRLDSDSLKREHDIMARISRSVRSEKLNKDIKEKCKDYGKYFFQQGEYFIRSVVDYEDLLDEAKQQSNCVASYAPSVVSGSKMIFFMRRVDKPEKSFITVEVRTKTMEVWQKAKAHNMPVTNTVQLHFLKEFQTYIRSVS